MDEVKAQVTGMIPEPGPSSSTVSPRPESVGDRSATGARLLNSSRPITALAQINSERCARIQVG